MTYLLSIDNKYPLFCNQNEDKDFYIYLKNPDGSIYDLSGELIISSQVKNRFKKLVFAPTISIVNTSQGIIKFTATSINTSIAGQFLYDIRIIKNGKSDFLETSVFTIFETVTL